jgi:hypothetical protein
MNKERNCRAEENSNDAKGNGYIKKGPKREGEREGKRYE